MRTTKISDRQFEIIEAAGRLLTTAGVSGLTIKNLAREMKFSESAIYRHFHSKEAIIIAMLDFLADNMDERLARVVSDHANPADGIQAIFTNQLEFFSRNPHFAVAVFSDGLMEASQPINVALMRIMQVKSRHLLPLVTATQAQGYWTSEVDSEQLTHVLMGSFRLLMFKWRIASFQFDIASQGAVMLGTFQTLFRK